MYFTTLNIDPVLYEQLDKICENHGITHACLIKEILKCVCMNYDLSKYSFGLTRYQKRRKGCKWKCFRIDFSEEECRLFYGNRFKFRVSVSKMLYVGFVLFLKEALENIFKEDEDHAEKIFNSYTSLIKKMLPYIAEETIFFKIIHKKKG